MRSGRFTGTGAVVAALVGGIVLSSLLAAPAPAAEAGKVKTLLLVGGTIHDWKGIGDVLEGYLKKSGKFDVTRVDQDLNALLADRVAPYDLVVFYWTVGKIGDDQRNGLLDHIAKGKGFVTLHSGADSFRGDLAWRKFVGGHFIGHPRYRMYHVSMIKTEHPIIAGIKEYLTTDEQYFLDYSYSKDLTILANGLHEGKLMPVIWTKPWKKGRVFYFAQGHDARACKQPMVKKIFLRGCLWAAQRKVVD